LTIGESSIASNSKIADRIEIAAQRETHRPAPLSPPSPSHQVAEVIYIFRKYPAKSRKPILKFIFSEKGLIGGVSREGAKITKVKTMD
jgi:hypothetical protein